MTMANIHDATQPRTGAAFAFGAITATLAALPIAAQADFIPPAGLNPGDPYRLLFVTSDVIQGYSADIATYDAFVTAQAALSIDLPTMAWQAIVSTPSISAIAHVSCVGACATAPIYNTQGVRVAANQSELWTSANLFASSPTYSQVEPYEQLTDYNARDQYGNTVNDSIWSGSNNDGTALADFELGAASGISMAGETIYGPGRWLRSYEYGLGQNYNLALYALSTFTAAETTETPEPMSAALLAAGLATLAAARRRRAARAG